MGIAAESTCSGLRAVHPTLHRPRDHGLLREVRAGRRHALLGCGLQRRGCRRLTYVTSWARGSLPLFFKKDHPLGSSSACREDQLPRHPYPHHRDVHTGLALWAPTMNWAFSSRRAPIWWAASCRCASSTASWCTSSSASCSSISTWRTSRHLPDAAHVLLEEHGGWCTTPKHTIVSEDDLEHGEKHQSFSLPALMKGPRKPGLSLSKRSFAAASIRRSPTPRALRRRRPASGGGRGGQLERQPARRPAVRCAGCKGAAISSRARRGSACRLLPGRRQRRSLPFFPRRRGRRASLQHLRLGGAHGARQPVQEVLQRPEDGVVVLRAEQPHPSASHGRTDARDHRREPDARDPGS